MSPAETPARPSNAIEVAYYDVSYSMARVSRSAKGRYDQLNPELALKAIRETQERLAKLAALCEEDIVVRKEAAKAAAKEARDFKRKQEVEKRRREREARLAAERAQRAVERTRARDEARKAREAAKAATKGAKLVTEIVEMPVADIDTGKIVAFQPTPVENRDRYVGDGLVAMVRAQREHEAEQKAARPSLFKRLLKKAA